jgi:hypothetical protein
MHILGIAVVLVVVFVLGQGHLIGSITDPLRALANSAQQFDFITRMIVFIFALAVAIVAGMAWDRTQNKKIAFVALAFGLMAFKWLLKVMDLFVSTGQFFPDHAENVIELISLALIAYALFGMRTNGKNGMEK